MMNKITGRCATVLSTLLVLATGLDASAERYFVAVKDRQALMQIQNLITLQGQAQLAATVYEKNGESVYPFKNISMTVETAMKNISAIVVNTEDPDQLANLKKSAAIEFIEKEMFHPAPKPIAGFHPWRPWDIEIGSESRAAHANPAMPWGIKAVRAPEAWALNGMGAGARVMVLDTGIDQLHPAVAVNFEKGQDFAMSTGGTDFRDLVGHGTHVAGTIVGKILPEGFAGVAPAAKVLMGRVCSTGGCSNLAVAQGIEWGIAEKVDVISMSLGGPLGSMAEKRGCEAAVAAGVTVVAASGNDGTPRVSYPAAFPTVIAVGAVDSHLQRASFSQYGPELAIVAPGVSVVSSVPMGSGRESKVSIFGSQSTTGDVSSTSFVGSPEVKSPLTNELVNAGFGQVGDFSAAVHGRFALISRGTITFADKVKNAIAEGAAGVVIFNNAPGLMQGAVTQDGSTVSVPVVMIEQSVGDQLVQELANGGHPMLTMQTISTDYANFDGTSMATPHVSGVVALIKAANPKLTPAQVKSVLQTTAGSVGTPAEYGAGMVDAAAAVAKAKSL